MTNKSPPWQQDFERYRAQIDDLPALIVVDWAAPGPQKSHPVRVLLRVSLRTPTKEGLLDASEASAIDHVVGTVVDVARDGLQAIYVGRMIYAGSVILAFYVPRAQKARTDLLALLQPELAPYELAHDTGDDPKWSYYLDMLYPDPYSLAIMNSLRQLKALAEKGDRPEASRMIDHTVFFPDGVAAKAAIKPLVEAGFRVHAPLPPRGRSPWALSFQKESDLSPASVDAFCRAILTAVGSFAGTYDGWRASVVNRLSLLSRRVRASVRSSLPMRSSFVRHGFLVSLSASGLVLGTLACGDKAVTPVAPPPHRTTAPPRHAS